MDHMQTIQTLSIIADVIIIWYFAAHVFRFAKRMYGKLNQWRKDFSKAMRQAGRG